MASITPQKPQGWALLWWLLIWFGSWGVVFLDWREVVRVPIFIPLGISLGSIALIAFWASWSWGDQLDVTSKMRNAIAGSFVVFYLVLLTDLLVLPSFRDQLERGTTTTTTEPSEAAELQDLLSFGEDVLGKFTLMVTVVVGFYFASVTTERLLLGRASDQAGDTPDPDTPDPDTPDPDATPPGRTTT